MCCRSFITALIWGPMKEPNHVSRSIVAVVLASTLMTACGGGISANVDAAAVADAATGMLEEAARRPTRTVKTDTATSTSTSDPALATTTTSATTSATTTTTAVAPITLSNLPADGTTQTNASIGHAADAAYTVYCRLDAYAPVPCPNPFDLGKTNPLAAGQHTVDYYKYTGTTLDTANPDVSYSWSIVAATTSAPTTSTSTSTPTTTTTTVAPTTSSSTTGAALPLPPYPVPTALSGAGSPTYDGKSTVTGGDGVVRLAAGSDPGGSGRPAYLHRIVRADWSPGSQAARTEKVWIDRGKYLLPGNDYWFAFAFRPKSGEWPQNTPGITDDEFLVFQTHSESNGYTQPDIALFIDAGRNRMYWQQSYSAAVQATTPEGVSVIHSQSLPAVNVWHKYIIHYRPGYSSGHAPRTEIWQAVGAGGYTKIVNNSSLNTYNWNTGSYPRIGFYKWGGTNWSTNYPTIAAHLTTLYMGEGVDRYNEAVKALDGL